MPGFAAAIFTSAFLLFWVQPLFSKMILPLLGGAPSVWNTAMMFFQLVLLAGYGYAHLLTRHVASLRWQVLIHGAVFAAGLAFLPLAVAQDAAPPSEGSPIAWLIGMLMLSVGWPFFALSASAPLLQAWFARGGHRAAGDPYFLYAASNAGSLLALLLFPILLEPELTLAGQADVWRYGYAALLLMLVLLGMLLLRARPVRAAVADADARTIGWPQRLLWIALAFIPSSLLLGVTTHITTDIASAPLFWVVPFALYLLTFVIAFARQSLEKQDWILKAQAAGIILVSAATILTVAYGLGGSVLAMAGTHLFAFFTAALMCHCELARRRPGASGLTIFYFCIAIGGALGGVFNALIAPVLFSTDLEYYLALVAACLLRGFVAGDAGRFTGRDGLYPLLLGIFVAAVVYHATTAPTLVILTRILFPLVCALTLYWFSERSNRFALGAAAMMGAVLLVQNTVDVLHSERSFFGISKIVNQKSMIALVHGTTLHGREFTDPARRREPLTYYARSGPLGQALALAGPRPRAALIGLGTGAVACYRRPGNDWTFFEIDGAVEKIARDTRYFHYLADCGGTKVALGDGRLLLQKAPDHSYDLIVVDAFSSDAVPTHLLTREALALYLRKLRPKGIILFNLSNKYLRLGPVLGNGVASVGAFARRQFYYPSKAEAGQGAAGSEWMAIAATRGDLDFLKADPRWEATSAKPDAAPWTDDFSNIFRVIVW